MKKAILPLSYKKLYETAYSMLENITPIKADCGELCEKACCKDIDGEVSGMYLFPEENIMLRDMPKGFSLYDTDFEYDYGQYADLLSCEGECLRTRRPLACRIFPLLPYINENDEMEIIVDPRGKAVCPMAKTMSVADFDKDFVSAVEKCFNMLAKNRKIRLFIQKLSRELDETVL